MVTPYDAFRPQSPQDLGAINDATIRRTEWQISQPQIFVPPAAGADFPPFTLGNRAFKLLFMFGQLATSAAVANRTPQLVFKTQNGEVLARLVAPSNQAASLTQSYTWGIDVVSQSVLGGDVGQSMPDLWMPPGASISIITGLIDVADQWTLGSCLYLMG